MVSHGLKAKEEDLDAAVVYLARYFGKANVNSATSRELQEELKKVPDLHQKRLDETSHLVQVNRWA